MSYFRLHCDQLQMTGSINQEAGPAVFRLIRGEPSSIKPDKLPFRFSFSEVSGRPLYAYYSGDCLMSRALVEKLQSTGVDNLQVFPAVLTERSSGAEREDYCVVNILGAVAAADMGKSDALSLGGGQVFTKLNVDLAKTRGLLMFRLAESLIDVIVHEKVAQAVSNGQFPGVLLSPVTAP